MVHPPPTSPLFPYTTLFRSKKIDVTRITRFLALRPLNLVAAHERIVDALDNLGHRIDRIERLVRVHFTGQIGVAGHLPARQVDGDRKSTRLNSSHVKISYAV